MVLLVCALSFGYAGILYMAVRVFQMLWNELHSNG